MTRRIDMIFLSLKMIVWAIIVVVLSASHSSAEFDAILPEANSVWPQIATENAGMFSLPLGWKVVSQDDLPEKNASADMTLYVQQSLYAQSQETSLEAALQIFSVWAADEKGTILSLPTDLLDERSGDLVAGLIDSRYANSVHVTKDVAKTDLEDLSIVTYAVEFSEESATENKEMKGLRYKRASLFNGEKLILVLVRYLPEHEEYWHGQFETLLNTWVVSLTFTPRPMGAIPTILASLPEPLTIISDDVAAPITPVPIVPVAEVEALPVSETPVIVAVSQPASVTSSFIFYSSLALTVFVFLFVVTGKILVWHSKRQEEMLLEELTAFDVKQEQEMKDSLVEAAAEKSENLPMEEQDTDRSPSCEMTINEEKSSEKIANESDLISDIWDEDMEEPEKEEFEEPYAPLSAFNQETELKLDAELTFTDFGLDKELLLDLKKSSEKTALDSDIDYKEENDSEGNDESDVSEITLAFDENVSYKKEAGFEKVYSLLNQALNSIEVSKVVTYESQSQTNAPTTHSYPNIGTTIEVMDELETMFGSSFVLDTLRNEVFKILEMKEGTPPILQTKDMAPDYLILKLCCSTLVNLLQTGRYHIGKGILSTEGQELLNLFGNINDLCLQRAYSTYEEVEKDAAFIQYSVRESG